MPVSGPQRRTTLRTLLLTATAIVGVSTAANAESEIKVMTSIKPVHSLVAGVMAGVGEPGLIVEGASTPHAYSLKPSQAAALQNANVVFWIGHDLEAFLEGPIETLSEGARVVELMDAHGLTKLSFREGGAFEAHDHGDHDDHDDHGHDDHAKAEKHDDHGHDDHGHDDHAKAEDHDDHAHGDTDPHVWLDPMNAKALVHEIEEALVAADPAHASAYEANAEALMKRLDALMAEVSSDVEPVKGRGFITFHDAYQYFETRFGLAASGVITVSPEVVPGAARVAEIQAKVKELGATCVFSEPQFEPRIIQVVTEGTDARTGVLDPLGAALDNGPDLYFELIRNMGQSLSGCLSKAS